jgi:hypothetical protein
MSFSPVLPLAGYAGWTFLKRTMTSQKTAFAAVSTSKRDEDYFRAKIGTVKTAEALVSDRRLLKVALGAFGLDADINSKAFVRKVLEGGTLTTGALANKLADKQYLAMSAAFGFGDFSTPRTQLSTFADEILTAYKNRQFETAVGEQNDDMRLAMNAERELATLSAKSTTEDAKWFTVMGSKPLRTVFEKAFGLPSSLAALDLDQQLTVFKNAASKAFGATSVSQFTDATKMDKLVKQFLIRSEATSGSTSTSGGATALQLLQSMRGA